MLVSHTLITVKMCALIENPSQAEVRAVIRFFHAKNRSPLEIHAELKEVYGPQVMRIQHVRKWCKKFDLGRETVTEKSEVADRRSSLMNL